MTAIPRKLRIACATGALVVLMACTRYTTELANGYLLVSDSSSQIYLVSSLDNEKVVAGPLITALAVEGNYIVGFAAQAPLHPVGHSTVGYFVIDTATRTIEDGLSAEALGSILKDRGITAAVEAFFRLPTFFQ